MNQTYLIVGPQGSGKTQLAERIARGFAGAPSSIVRIATVSRMMGYFGLGRVLNRAAALIVEMDRGDPEAWSFLKNLVDWPTVEVDRKGQYPERIAVPPIVVTSLFGPPDDDVVRERFIVVRLA